MPENKITFYFQDILSCIIILSLFFLLNADIYPPLNFEQIGKGIRINSSIESALMTICILPFIMALTPRSNFYPKDISTAKEIFGYPIILLPDTRIEFFLFNIKVITGVVFEEFYCRQFMFYSFNQTLKLQGDAILVISSLLFSMGHIYQGWKGVLGSFIAGLVLGKIFMMKEDISYPIILHLISSLTISVLAYRRIKAMKTNV